MKKWAGIILAAMLVGYFGWLPFEASDAGTLYVVETLLVEADGNEVRLYSGDLEGSGKNAVEAAENMEQKTPGQLFLRQTKRLIFCDGAERHISALELPDLPMGAGVYVSAESAGTLSEELSRLEKVLDAREKREKRMPTLAQMKNSTLKKQSITMAVLSQEETGEES